MVILTRGFEARVIAFGPLLDPDAIDGAGVDSCTSLEALLRTVEDVIVHVPPMGETRHLIRSAGSGRRIWRPTSSTVRGGHAGS